MLLCARATRGGVFVAGNPVPASHPVQAAHRQCTGGKPPGSQHQPGVQSLPSVTNPQRGSKVRVERLHHDYQRKHRGGHRWELPAQTAQATPQPGCHHGCPCPIPATAAATARPTSGCCYRPVSAAETAAGSGGCPKTTAAADPPPVIITKAPQPLHRRDADLQAGHSPRGGEAPSEPCQRRRASGRRQS